LYILMWACGSMAMTRNTVISAKASGSRLQELCVAIYMS
jgi:hypothetical protein